MWTSEVSLISTWNAARWQAWWCVSRTGGAEVPGHKTTTGREGWGPRHLLAEHFSSRLRELLHWHDTPNIRAGHQPSPTSPGPGMVCLQEYCVLPCECNPAVHICPPDWGIFLKEATWASCGLNVFPKVQMWGLWFPRQWYQGMVGPIRRDQVIKSHETGVLWDRNGYCENRLLHTRVPLCFVSFTNLLALPFFCHLMTVWGPHLMWLPDPGLANLQNCEPVKPPSLRLIQTQVSLLQQKTD